MVDYETTNEVSESYFYNEEAMSYHFLMINVELWQ